MEVDFRKMIEASIENVVSKELDTLGEDKGYINFRGYRSYIVDMIAKRFVNENYEEIAQAIPKEKIIELVTQRAILLSAERITH